MQLSVIIPTLNAATTLARTLAALEGCGEVLVIDGGSTDATPKIGEAHGALVIGSARGRGVQLAAPRPSRHGSATLQNGPIGAR